LEIAQQQFDEIPERAVAADWNANSLWQCD